jgi:hypothetical protein
MAIGPLRVLALRVGSLTRERQQGQQQSSGK